ncbi:MAG TPA: class I SAM-dependent methyltransferase [Geodermatophilus sp.]|nr:class I SAM-dependent methyltransferase [Geodermatophilus sp.]
MDLVAFRRRAARTRMAPLVAFPVRLSAVARHNARVWGRSAHWLAASREHTNYTYDLTERNLEHLAWWVANLTGEPVERIREFVREAGEDADLRDHVRQATLRSSRRGLADPTVRFGRRLGWYALVRALRPERVIETGTDKGLGSVVLASALLRNGQGRLTTIDVNPESGYLIGGRYAEVVDRVVGDSLSAIREESEPVGVFLHDSLHTPEYETAEFRAVEPRLTERSVVLSDNSHMSDALSRWAEATGRRFSFFAEQPAGHWYPGDGIGAAWHPETLGDGVR